MQRALLCFLTQRLPQTIAAKKHATLHAALEVAQSQIIALNDRISSLQSDALEHVEVLAAKAAELHQASSKLAQSEKNLDELKQRFAEHEAHLRHAPAHTRARTHTRAARAQ